MFGICLDDVIQKLGVNEVEEVEAVKGRRDFKEEVSVRWISNR
jgi:hypothetical protein